MTPMTLLPQILGGLSGSQTACPSWRASIISPARPRFVVIISKSSLRYHSV